MKPTTNSPVIGAERDLELLKEAESYIYSEVGGHKLQAHFFSPKERTEKTPIIAFFHGGMWDNGSPTQFLPQCHHYAHRGLLAVSFDYRTRGKHDASPEDSVHDIQSAILRLRQNHQQLGIDPERIIVMAAGAGAYGALCAAMHPEILADEQYDSRPQAVIALSSIVNTSRKGIGTELFADVGQAKKFSPSAHIKKNLPPTLFMHGSADRTSPFDLVNKFVRSMKRKKNNCELLEFDGADHSFFNFNVSKNRFDLSLAAADKFLTSLGFLPPSEQKFW